ncbi:lipid-A-disaccharide synthase [Chromatiales bacterium (ex Bugula neritina AB1)]|nr:lipid-A-disaccharide synthase [Chromatiales bacterium (ex Bugula neritina AB1)]
MKIMISVGEASGDMHSANVLRKLRTLTTQPIEAYGMGGKRLAACGMELTVDNTEHSVMGLIEVLHKYPTLRGHLNLLRQALSQNRPDILMLVDYPHFNMKLATTAKALDIPVLYYITPKVWASRAGRLTELKKTIDHAAVILPFEADLFEKHKIPATYVGNPLLDNTALVAAGNRHKPQNDTTRIALLPGSRKSEVSYLLPVMLGAAKKIKMKYPEAEFVLPVAETIDPNLITVINAATDIDIELISSTDYDKLAQCDIALAASGTATLELAIMGIPMVVGYKMNPLSYVVVKRWLTIENISLVNIVADKKVVPELLQDEATAENFFTEADALLSDKEAYLQQKAHLTSVYNQLGTGGAATRLCKIITELVVKSKSKSVKNVVHS